MGFCSMKERLSSEYNKENVGINSQKQNEKGSLDGKLKKGNNKVREDSG